jgi:hypothetical protein
MSPPATRPDQIAAEAARAARQASEEATAPEAKFFLRQHAIVLERIAASYRRIQRTAGESRGALALVAPLLSELPL